MRTSEAAGVAVSSAVLARRNETGRNSGAAILAGWRAWLLLNESTSERRHFSTTSCVWLRACRAGKWGRPSERDRLLDEAKQLAKILAAIIISAKRRRPLE